jgi:hypothetical protein
MDYEVKRDDGKLIWYKLVGHNVIPIEVISFFIFDMIDL